MRRGDLYRVVKPTSRDPRKFRVFVVVSRQVVLDSKFSTAICAPIYSVRHGLSTQVEIGPEEGLKHESAIHCDELVSIPKSALTDFVGTLPASKLRMLDLALIAALGIEQPAS
ncbi:MAG TPA: type II toxin-antitoxin system PemK/MazF family toxin [Vicinamibacteria bacterium]